MILLLIQAMLGTLLFVIGSLIIFTSAAKPIQRAVEIYKQVACAHTWGKEQKISVYADDDGNVKNRIPVKYEHHVKCTSCSYIKRWET